MLSPIHSDPLALCPFPPPMFLGAQSYRASSASEERRGGTGRSSTDESDRDGRTCVIGDEIRVGGYSS